MAGPTANRARETIKCNKQKEVVCSDMLMKTINFCSRMKSNNFLFYCTIDLFDQNRLLFRPLLRGGGTIYSTGFFFVQSILADRYIHRRELRLVSLESLSSVEYGNKKIFLILVFDREISRFNLPRK